MSPHSESGHNDYGQADSFGYSAGIELPKEVIQELHVGLGNISYLIESPDGYIPTAYYPEFN